MMHFAMDCIRCKHHMLDDDDDHYDAITMIITIIILLIVMAILSFFSTKIPQLFLPCTLCSAELQLVTDVPTYFI